MYKSYNSSLTIAYKTGYIFIACIDCNEVVKYQVDAYAYIQYAKSMQAAKIAISKHVNSGRALLRKID